MAERSWLDSGSTLSAGVGWGAEEKPSCVAAVSVNKRVKRRAPADSQAPAETQKIPGCFIPGGDAAVRSYICQVVPLSQHPMGTPEPEHNHPKPTGNQPWGQKAVRIHRHRGAVKTLLSHLLPELQDQEQSPYHGIHGVLKVGDQLGRQDRKGALPFIAQKAGNRNALFPELREQVNGISPVGGDSPVAILLATNGTGRAKERDKVNLTGEKRFPVFPNALVCVRVRKLDF
jgi:hypothetical protein